MLLSWLTVLGSIVVLSVGGDVLVRYSVRLATTLRISPTVVGLTVVAFGTSAPELATALIAAFDDHADLAVGNVVGSNIANIGLILGATAVLAPVVAERRFVRREIVFLSVTALALMSSLIWGELNRLMAFVLLAGLAYFLRMLIKDGRIAEELTEPSEPGKPLLALLGTVVGLVLLIVGARWLVIGATTIAESFGVSERVIGLTVVAFGTSVPELAAALVSAYRKEVGLVLGNIVGSNIFNTLLILPAAVLVKPIPISFLTFGIDLLVMLAFGLALHATFFGNHRLSRFEGGLLLVGYCGYVFWLGTQPTVSGGVLTG